MSYNSINNKNENLIQILTKYESKYWEYLIKKLAQEQNYENINEYSLDNLILELQDKNKEFPKELSEKLKNIILKIRIIYNSKIETNDDLSKIPINLFEKENIQKWSISKRTLTSINNEEFLPEVLAIIDRANVLNEGYHIRDVQFISILLIILSPKNKGVFAQIKTGEGKSTIVSVIAVIKALQNKYVDILSSSIVLAQRDKEEKKSFYEYFNLSVGSSDDDDDNISLYEKNIVYGDALMFEGDILEVEFSKDPNSKRAKNPGRGFRCIIIDEVDSMCIDNLGSSTRLSSSFPSYEYLKILYPLIYNSLNIIDEHMDNGYYGKDLNEEKRKEIVVENLIKVTKELLDKNKKSEERFILPKNLKKYIENQIPYWSNSAYDAKHYYKENYHYIIAKDNLDEPFKNTLQKSGYIPKENFTIAPVDFSNTGVVELKSSWSDGLSQFLQIKHGLKLQAENITTTFISHYSFFIRYINSKNNNIYGVTGTIGTDKSKYVLKTLFHVNIFIIPPFRPNKLILLNNKAEFSNKEAWQNEILNNIELNAIELSRTVLVICLTIEESNDLYDFLIKKNYNKNKLFKYQRNSDKLSKGKYEKGDVIIATNLAGRGTDIKLSEEVEKNGGMHVIITFLPSNQRVEEQAVGRTARSGAKGSSIIIVNDIRKMEDIKKLRNDREEIRMENIIQNNINRIKLKDELFDNFSNLYHDLQNKLINNNLLSLNTKEYNFYKNVKFIKEFSILDDLEENWGLWLKEMKIDDFDNNKSENEIKNSYQIFENKIRKNFIVDNINNIPLLNPFNYYSGKKFNVASEKDFELCFFSNYLKDMTNIEDNIESISTKTSQTLDNTISSLKDALCPQIQSTIILANNIKNTNKLNSSIINEISEDADNKIKIIEQLINEVQMNKNAIDHHLSNKNSKIILHTCEISELTKDINLENYFKDIGIPYFYKLNLEEKKNWFGVISIMIIGVFEIGIGIFLTYYMVNDFGFIEEGLNDIKYGIDCLLGKEKFDWKEVGKRKLAFAIGLAVNATVGFIRCNLKIPFKKPQKVKNIKETFNKIGKQVGKKLTKQGVNIGIQISMEAFGKDFIITIITKFKEYSKSITVSFFQKKIKDFIVNKYGVALNQMLTIEVVSGNNEWTRILTEQLKVGCRALTKLTNIIVKQLINLIKLLINKKDDWKNLLISTFKNCCWEGADIFKNSLNEGLEHLKLGFLNIFKKFVEKKLPDDVKNGILTFNDLLDKTLDFGDSLKTKNLMEILVENNIISEKGIINGKVIFGATYIQKKFMSMPVVIDKFKKFTLKKAIGTSNIIDLMKAELEKISNELNNIFKSKIDEGIENIDNLFNNKINDINKFIDEIFDKYIVESIDKIEKQINKKVNDTEYIFDVLFNEINNKYKIFDDFSHKLELNINEKIIKLEKVNIFLKEQINEKLELFENIIDRQIDEKINLFNKHIKNIEENVLSKFNSLNELVETEENKINNSIEKSIGKYSDSQSEKMQGKIKDIKKKVSDSMQTCYDLSVKLKTIVEDNIKNFKNTWNKIKNSEKLEKVNKTIKQIQSSLEEVISYIINLIKSLKEKLKEIINFIKNIKQLINEKVTNMKEILKNEKSSFPEKLQKIKNELNKIKEEIKNKIIEIKTNIMNKIEVIKQQIYDKILEFIKEVKSNINHYLEIFQNIINEIEKIIVEKINKIEEKLKLNILEGFGNKVNNLLNMDIREKIEDKIKNTDKKLSDKVHNALEDIDFKQFKEDKNFIIETLKNYQNKIDNYDFESKKNETFSILENCLVNQLFDVILDALKGTEMSKYLANIVEEYKKIVDDINEFIDENIDENELKKLNSNVNK